MAAIKSSKSLKDPRVLEAEQEVRSWTGYKLPYRTKVLLAIVAALLVAWGLGVPHYIVNSVITILNNLFTSTQTAVVSFKAAAAAAAAAAASSTAFKAENPNHG
jgi:hypothetical protein